VVCLNIVLGPVNTNAITAAGGHFLLQQGRRRAV
jgi:hypothetical protein